MSDSDDKEFESLLPETDQDLTDCQFAGVLSDMYESERVPKLTDIVERAERRSKTYKWNESRSKVEYEMSKPIIIHGQVATEGVVIYQQTLEKAGLTVKPDLADNDIPTKLQAHVDINISDEDTDLILRLVTQSFKVRHDEVTRELVRARYIPFEDKPMLRLAFKYTDLRNIDQFASGEELILTQASIDDHIRQGALIAVKFIPTHFILDSGVVWQSSQLIRIDTL